MFSFFEHLFIYISFMQHFIILACFSCRGYCAPEYQFNGKMSFKSDVYSLGVIIREMVTGTRNEPNITIVRGVIILPLYIPKKSIIVLL